MSEYKISWRPEALQDVSEHILFLLNVNTQAAIDLKKQLFDGVNSLKEFPERSPILEMPNNSPLEIRKKVINKRYLVLYAIQNKEVEIYRVLDSRKKFEYLI